MKYCEKRRDIQFCPSRSCQKYQPTLTTADSSSKYCDTSFQSDTSITLYITKHCPSPTTYVGAISAERQKLKPRWYYQALRYGSVWFLNTKKRTTKTKQSSNGLGVFTVRKEKNDHINFMFVSCFFLNNHKSNELISVDVLVERIWCAVWTLLLQ